MRLFLDAEVVTRSRLSGIGHASLEILRALDARAAQEPSLEITAIVPYGKSAAFRRYGLRNIRVRQLPGGKYVGALLSRTSLQVPVDVLFGRGTYVFLDYKNWYVPFSRSVTFVYDVAFRIYPDTVNDKNRRYLERNMPRWLNRTDAVACISGAAEAELVHYYPAARHKTHVVHLGIDPKVFYPRTASEIMAVRQKYKLPERYFLFVGNIEPRKNLLLLLDAYQQYADTNTLPIALVLVGGDGWNNQAILDRLEQLQRKAYPVYHPTTLVPDEDLPALYSGAVSLVHVALHEGYGLPPVQAQACGAPLVVSDLPVFREILSPSDVIFVDPRAKDAIARALSGQVGKKHHKGHISTTWKDALGTLIQVIQGLDNYAA